jgi:hypothetical protein
MCAKCDEINRRIEHLRQLTNKLTDQQTLDGIAALISELEAQKAALHPDQK